MVQRAAQAGDMLIQLRQSTNWAFQCLSAMRDDVRPTQVEGREARRVGEFVVVDAGENRLLVTRQDRAAGSLASLDAAEEAEQPHRAAQRVERLGDPLLFSVGAFANQLGLEVAETVITQQGDALRVRVLGTMENERAAQRAVERLEQGISLAQALVERREQQGGQQGQQPRGTQPGGPTDTPGDAEFMTKQKGAHKQGGQKQRGAAQGELQENLKTVLDSIRVERREDMVRVSMNLPDADTQRYLGQALGRFLAEGGPQRFMQRRQQLEEQREQQEQTPARPGQGERPGG